MNKLYPIFRKIIVANELGGDTALAYKFSDPDGVRTGKSGWSFGICQFDINNNKAALKALRSCGFTEGDIIDLQLQSDIDMEPMDALLRANQYTIDQWDQVQLQHCLDWVTVLCGEVGTTFDHPLTILYLADYHNQLFMSRGGALYKWLEGRKGPVTPAMILNFKLGLKWGKIRPDDVLRRFANATRIIKESMKTGVV